MIEEIIEIYDDFHDSLITKIQYNRNFNYYEPQKSIEPDVELYLSCFNCQNYFERELIKIVFTDVSFFNFQNYEGMVSSALIKKENDIITFDFFPIIYTEHSGEDLNSFCIIKCKSVNYEVME